MASFKKYNLKSATQGNTVKVPMVYPGQDVTEDFLMVRSRHAQEYRDADLQAQRKMSSLIAAAGGIDKVDSSLLEDVQMRAFCKLVESWSFDEPLTDDNLLEFFDSNPQMYDIVNVECARDTLFFAKPVKL